MVLELNSAPITQVFAQEQAAGATQLQAASAAQAQLAAIEAEQQALLRPLAKLNVTVLYQLQRVYNGIAVSVARDQLAALAQLPGVKGYHTLSKKFPLNSSGVPLIGAPEIWNDAGLGVTGEGISVGIIDTGIDYNHSNFGGSGDVADFEANDPTVITDTQSADFFGAGFKVAGGFDFVGDAYNEDDVSRTQPPTPDPLDCNGHGSHVAGTSAGSGVNSDGSTFTGPYTGTVDFDNLRIGPGVAPEATLYALKVFGCDGATFYTDLAIEWAVDPNADGDLSDKLDVINMSLGSDSGDPFDSTAVASDNAALAGVIVVASAGNSGDSYYITGTPGTSSRTISVASSVDERSVFDGFRVNSPAEIAGVKPAATSVNFDWRSFEPITSTVYYSDTLTSCSAYTPEQSALVTGTVVLINWEDGQCGSGTRANNAQAAGAVGLIIADNAEPFSLLLAGNATLPTLSTPKSVGAEIAAATATGDVEVTLSNEYLNAIKVDDPNFVDTISDFTSRGPRRGDSFLKPDIAAPGQSIFSAAVGSGNEGTNLNGTSMAAPHVAGAMALLRAIYPDWSVEELKALAMNTANNDLFSGTKRSGDTYGPGRIGTGRVNVPNTTNTDVIAYESSGEGLVSVSFGKVEVLSSETRTLTKTVTVANKGDAETTYTVDYDAHLDQPGVGVSVSPETVTIAAGETTTVTVVLTADGSAMNRGVTEATVAATQGLDLPRHYIAEVAGYLTLTPEVITLQATPSSDEEVPPVDSDVTASASMTYTLATGELEYYIEFSSTIEISGPGAHIHIAPRGLNGPILVDLVDRDDLPLTFDEATPLTGTVVITEANRQALLTEGLYINLHTQANLSGELRGQIAADQPFLRVPIHAVTNVASEMSAQQTVFDFSATITGTAAISLTGTGIETDTLTSIVTAFELQEVSPLITGDTYSTTADLAYIGAYSDYGTITTTIPISDTYLYFAVATHADWTRPDLYDNEIGIYIDTNSDGQDDFWIYNSSIGFEISPDGDNVYIATLVNLESGDITFEFLNVVPATTDTGIHNSNVRVFPVAASNLGLTEAQSAISYRVVSFIRPLAEGTGGLIDVSKTHRFVVNRPGITFDGALTGPAHVDLPGETVSFSYDRNALTANGSEGVLLMHHHNASGNRVDVVELPGTLVYLPAIYHAAPAR
ncbi:S8 family serine peptidase [Candidatus Gracilibacteria bacterium]|nr:S8 family serine peptidase [Candidatus Gracilibacteria bacterium]